MKLQYAIPTILSVDHCKKVYIFSDIHILQGQDKEQNMKEKIKTFFCVLILLGALPYIITIVLQGNETKEKGQPSSVLGNTEFFTDNSQDTDGLNLDIESYVTGMVAKEIPVTYETEALKAQAVIARTNLMAAMEQKGELPETVSQKELLALWGEEEYGRNYRRLVSAVEDTKGVVITYQGNYIYAAFHAVSAGSTRSAGDALGKEDMIWLSAVESPEDIPAEDYLKVVFLGKEEFIQWISRAFPEVSVDKEHPLDSILVEERDKGCYVLQMKIGEKQISGEEFRNALELNSACFYLKEVEGEIRIVTKGLGHGLGLSQYGANQLAMEGLGYQEILSYYFKNVEISD